MKPIVISTWKHGIDANKTAFEILSRGGNSLDAVERGVMVAEDDPTVLSVGYGGLPDADGRVTLDAAIMDWKARVGSVVCVENIKNPVSLARLILENTEHTMLAGDGAYDFAIKNGFKPESLLTENSIRQFRDWKSSNSNRAEEIHTEEFSIPKRGMNINEDGNHDTIGMVAIDSDGHVSSACTTSGMAWKLHGRVGDSPVIGAGLYVDGEIGGAASTGRGEECIRACGSFLIVELMRNGIHPKDACKKACERVYKLNLLSSKNRDHIYQVGFIALNIKGEFGAFAVRHGFQFAVNDSVKSSEGNMLEKALFDSDFLITEDYIIKDQ